MTLTNEETDEVRQTVIDMFGEEAVKDIDLKWMALHDIRLASTHNYDFLAKIREQYLKDGADANTLVAGVLYGIRLGEVGREYAYEQEKLAATGMQYQ